MLGGPEEKVKIDDFFLSCWQEQCSVMSIFLPLTHSGWSWAICKPPFFCCVKCCSIARVWRGLEVGNDPIRIHFVCVLRWLYGHADTFVSWERLPSVSSHLSFLDTRVIRNMVLVYVGKPSVYIPCATMLWGAISFCTGTMTIQKIKPCLPSN